MLINGVKILCWEKRKIKKKKSEISPDYLSGEVCSLARD